MSMMNTLKNSVDSNTADSIMNTYRSSVRRVFIAPYKCMTFAITSCMLLGARYSTFVIIAAVLCVLFSILGVILFVLSEDMEYLAYTVGGLAAIMFMLSVLRKDNKHTELLRESERYIASQQNDDIELD